MFRTAQRQQVVGCCASLVLHAVCRICVQHGILLATGPPFEHMLRTLQLRISSTWKSVCAPLDYMTLLTTATACNWIGHRADDATTDADGAVPSVPDFVPYATVRDEPAEQSIIMDDRSLRFFTMDSHEAFIFALCNAVTTTNLALRPFG